MDESPAICIIILNWNGWKDTIECLESIFGIEYSNYSVIVVDNDSTNDSISAVLARVSSRHRAGHGRGAGASANAGRPLARFYSAHVRLAHDQ